MTDLKALTDLARRLKTKEPYKSDVQIMVEMFGQNPPVVILGQGDYPTAVGIADRVTADMNAGSDAITTLAAALIEAEKAMWGAVNSCCADGMVCPSCINLAATLARIRAITGGGDE